MTDPDRLAAEILVAAEVPAEQEHAVTEAFGALGVAVRSRVVPVHRGSVDAGWLLLATLPLQAFLSTLGASLANGSTQALRRMVGRIHGSQPEAAPAPRPLILQDAATRLQIVLEAGLPTEAYDALVSLDLSKFRHGPLHYDQHRGAWRSELDE
jgi:hypothetical protein